MIAHIVDTHILIWQISDRSKLSTQADSILDAADHGKGIIYVPTIVVVELIYLSERRRIAPEVLKRTLELLEIPRGSYRSVPLNLGIARRVELIDRSRVPDMPDRIIAATSLALGVPVLTKDARLQALSSIRSIW